MTTYELVSNSWSTPFPNLVKSTSHYISTNLILEGNSKPNFDGACNVRTTGHWMPLLVQAKGFAGEKNNVQLSLYPSKRGPFSLMIDHRPREVRRTEELECTKKGPPPKCTPRGERNRLGKIWRTPQEIKVSNKDEIPSLNVLSTQHEILMRYEWKARRDVF